MTLRIREQRRRQLQAMLAENGLTRQQAADLLHSSIDRIDSWLKPETSKSSNPVPLWAIELLGYKLKDEAVVRELEKVREIKK